MKVKDLIKKLQEFPQDMDISIWDGYNQEFVTNFKLKKAQAERFAITDKMLTQKARDAGYSSHFGSWTDIVPYAQEKHIERKQFINIEPQKRPKIKL